MKGFWKTFAASGLAMLVVGFILVIIFLVGLSSTLGSLMDPMDSDFVLKDKTVLHLDLNMPITDHRQVPDHPFEIGVPRTTGLYEIMRTLSKAKDDSRIEGIVIEPNATHVGMATLREIRMALEDFKSSGKFIYSYGEQYDQKGLYLASVADKVFMMPSGRVDLRGVSANLLFLKGMFDKLGVEMQVIRGPNNIYKSAVEPLLQEEMSEANREQIEAIVQGAWSEMSTTIAKARGIAPERLDLIADSVLIRMPKDAVDEKLVDELRYWDEIRDMIAGKTDVRDKDHPRLFSFQSYMLHHAEKDEDEGARIALVFAQGDIISGNQKKAVISSGHVARQLRKARMDDDVEVVVFRVNSGGGSALASDVIWREATLLAQQKKLVVSMGDYAASGGYMISCPANVIYAQPNTITGSIGVFAVIPFTGEFMREKMGVTFDQVNTHAHSTLSLNKRLSPSDRTIVQSYVDDIYMDFIQKVSQGRVDLTTEMVDSLGRGRVWTGMDAAEIGLVDKVGGLRDALDEAASLIGKGKDAKVKVYPKHKEDPVLDLLDKIMNGREDKYEEESSKEMTPAMLQDLVHLYQMASTLEDWEAYQARVPFLVEVR